MTDIPDDVMKTADWMESMLVSLTREDGVEFIAQQIMAERERDRWMDISTAPRDGTPFLAALSNGWVLILRDSSNGYRFAWYDIQGLSIPIARTHPPDSLGDNLIALWWQPLPPPKGPTP